MLSVSEEFLCSLPKVPRTSARHKSGGTAAKAEKDQHLVTYSRMQKILVFALPTSEVSRMRGTNDIAPR